MIIAKLYNILQHLMESGVPLHTEIKVGLYSKQDGEATLQALDLNGLVADAETGKVYLACGDRSIPFQLHHTGEKPHDWETFVLMVDGSGRNELPAIGLDNEILQIGNENNEHR
jgi:hypothetical protein